MTKTHAASGVYLDVALRDQNWMDVCLHNGPSSYVQLAPSIFFAPLCTTWRWTDPSRQWQARFSIHGADEDEMALHVELAGGN